MKNVKLLAILGLLFFSGFASPNLHSQIVVRDLVETFDADTTTNADTIIFTLTWDLASRLTFDYAWQVTSENVSGTSSATVYVEETLDGTNWVRTDTASVSGSQTQFVTGNNTGTEMRLYVISSGTGVTRFVPILRIRPKI